MNKNFRVFTVLFAVVVLCFIVINTVKASNSYGLISYTDEIKASSRILTYHQSGSQQATWQSKKLAYDGAQGYMGENSPSGKGWGCGIYALAHAIQWASGNSKTNSNGGAFLDEFIKISNKPWAGTLTIKYSSMLSNNGVKTTNVPSTEGSLRDFFDQYGAIVGNIKNSSGSGHYIVAIGIAEGKNGEIWVHIIDSTCYSGIYRFNDKGYKVYNFSTGAEINKNSISGFGDYWIPLSALQNSFAWKAAIISTNPVTRRTGPDYLNISQTVASLNMSDTLTLTVAAYPTGASNSVTWASSDNSVATVSENGVVTALQAGKQAIITATSTVDATKKATCQVTTYYQQGSDTLKFNGIKYPHTYNKNSSVSWSGTVTSDVALSSVVMNLYSYTNATKYTQSGSITAGSKSFSLNSFGNSTLKNLPTGRFAFELIATDVAGRRLSFANDTCQATTSGSQVYYDAPGSFTRPVLKATGEQNGHYYEVYTFEARDWDYAKDFANELGGHLATVIHLLVG